MLNKDKRGKIGNREKLKIINYIQQKLNQILKICKYSLLLNNSTKKM